MKLTIAQRLGLLIASALVGIFVLVAVFFVHRATFADAGA
jgi:hypothetical protein